MSASLSEHEAKADELARSCREAEAKAVSLEAENRKLAANAAAAHQQNKQQQQQQQQAQQQAQPSPQPSPQANGKRGSRRSGAPSDEPHNVNGTVNVSQNTAVYMGHPPPHISAFPQNGYQVDPSLEATISQLHTALNTLTAMARASSCNQKASDMAHAKLDALAQFGIGTFDPGMANSAVSHYAHQNSYFY